MISARALQQFIVLAEELHFGRAAARLHMSQPPLSQALARLEERLGVRLLDRAGKAVALTEGGRVFLDEARALLRQQEQAVLHTRAASAGQRGTVAMGFVGSVSYGLLPELLALYRREAPAITVQLHEMPSTDQREALDAGRIDLGIVRLPLADADGLRMQTIRRERMVAVLPKGHRLAQRRAIGLAELADETFMVFPPERVLSLHAKTLLACQAAGFSPRTGLTAWQMPTMVSLVAAGQGVALLPAQTMHMPHPGVRYRPLQDRNDHLALEIALAWREDRASPACRRIVALTLDTAPQGGQGPARDGVDSSAAA
jgi:DNA-binding transcriptional LysR family regulator